MSKKYTNEEREAAFLNNLDVSGKLGCWEWNACRNKLGYGMAGFGRKNMWLTHRIAYTMWAGEIPSGMMVCHHCDNPRCCNPKHLFLGTALDNNKDMARKGRNRQPFGEAHPKAKLTYVQVDEIRSRYANETGRSLADEFGVSQALIVKICAGCIWRKPSPVLY